MKNKQIIKKVLKELEDEGEDMINFEGHGGIWAMNRALDLYKEDVTSTKNNCIMRKDGKCQSQYHFGVKCYGDNIEKNCPYFVKMEEKRSDKKMSKM